MAQIKWTPAFGNSKKIRAWADDEMDPPKFGKPKRGVVVFCGWKGKSWCIIPKGRKDFLLSLQKRSNPTYDPELAKLVSKINKIYQSEISRILKKARKDKGDRSLKIGVVETNNEKYLAFRSCKKPRKLVKKRKISRVR